MFASVKFMADRKVDTGIIQRGDAYRFTVALGMDNTLVSKYEKL